MNKVRESKIVWQFLTASLLVVLICLKISFRQEKIMQKKGSGEHKKNEIQFNKLSPEEEAVIINKATEPPNSGKYNKHKEKGIYSCRQCKTPLFRSVNKFDSDCGWPAFEKEIPGSVKRIPDADGKRTEIVCTKCDGHLGHVFIGENITQANTRHCVNSVSIDFIPEAKMGRAIFASGCFWGTEYYMQKAPGVLQTTVGYIGGKKTKPTYEEVCANTTGHAEAVEVLYDQEKTDYKTLAKLFFETHDPGQLNRQGPDVGEQYRSEIFYFDDEQKAIAEKLINTLEEKGIKVVTKLTPAGTFWDAEDYHQEYYDKKRVESLLPFLSEKVLKEMMQDTKYRMQDAGSLS